MASAEWVHNDDEARWELRVSWRDEPRQRDEERVAAWVTDEMIARIAYPATLAASLIGSLGSVPPPLTGHLPPYDPAVVISEGTT